jgi:hypothetical protein
VLNAITGVTKITKTPVTSSVLNAITQDTLTPLAIVLSPAQKDTTTLIPQKEPVPFVSTHVRPVITPTCVPDVYTDT